MKRQRPLWFHAEKTLRLSLDGGVESVEPTGPEECGQGDLGFLC